MKMQERQEARKKSSNNYHKKQKSGEKSKHLPSVVVGAGVGGGAGRGAGGEVKDWSPLLGPSSLASS